MKNAAAVPGKTHTEHGYIDYYSLLMALNRYTAADAEWIKSCLEGLDSVPKHKIHDAIDLRANLMHEVTHFLDMTTTLWGLEYTCRKSRVLSCLVKGSDYTSELEVFKLNTAEIEVHSALLLRDEKSLEGCTLNHSISVHKDFGPILTVIYRRDGVDRHRIPLSMLSVFECHATANETIRKILDTERLDFVERKIALSLLEKDFVDHLNDPTLTEYTCLLYLMKAGFPELSLLQMLTLFSAIVRFSLDLASIDVAALANLMGFLPSTGGWTLSQDLRRGASRQVICFKTILFLHGWLSNETEKKGEALQFLAKNPRRAISKVWRILGFRKAPKVAGEIERHVYLSNLRENLCCYPDYTLADESLRFNAGKLFKKPAGAHEFSDLRLLGFLLTEDISEIAAPTQMSQSALDLFDRYDDVIARLRAVLRSSNPKKFFWEIETPTFFPFTVED